MSCIISSVIYVNPIACVCAEHPLARHCDILTAIETRISLLGMTFMKYVDLDLCCFIPGKVIDEIFTVLRTIQAGAIDMESIVKSLAAEFDAAPAMLERDVIEFAGRLREAFR